MAAPQALTDEVASAATSRSPKAFPSGEGGRAGGLPPSARSDEVFPAEPATPLPFFIPTQPPASALRRSAP